MRIFVVNFYKYRFVTYALKILAAVFVLLTVVGVAVGAFFNSERSV